MNYGIENNHSSTYFQAFELCSGHAYETFCGLEDYSFLTFLDMICYTTTPSKILTIQCSPQGKSEDLGGQAGILKCKAYLSRPLSPLKASLQPPEKLRKQ